MYGYRCDNPFGIHEDNDQQPTMLYGHHKVAVEQYLNTESANYPATHTAIIRPTAIAGPQGQTLSPLRGLTAHKFFLLSNGGQARTQAIHEQDMAALIGRVIEGQVAGTYNAAPDDYATWAEIGKLSGLPTVSLPRSLLNLATRLNTVLPALDGFTRDVVDLLSETLVCDNSAARNHLGWSPHYTTKEAFAALFGASVNSRELSNISG